MILGFFFMIVHSLCHLPSVNPFGQCKCFSATPRPHDFPFFFLYFFNWTRQPYITDSDLAFMLVDRERHCFILSLSLSVAGNSYLYIMQEGTTGVFSSLPNYPLTLMPCDKFKRSVQTPSRQEATRCIIIFVDAAWKFNDACVARVACCEGNLIARWSHKMRDVTPYQVEFMAVLLATKVVQYKRRENVKLCSLMLSKWFQQQQNNNAHHRTRATLVWIYLPLHPILIARILYGTQR